MLYVNLQKEWIYLKLPAMFLFCVYFPFKSVESDQEFLYILNLKFVFSLPLFQLVDKILLV